MPKHKKPKDFIRVPQYPGGNTALKEFLDKNLIYPKEAFESKVEGEVEAEYHVDGLGKIKNIKILKKLGSGCDEEVLRLIKLLVYAKAINRGLKTLTRKTLKITFKLPKQQGAQINYSIVKKPEPPKANPKKNIGYTITFNKP
jgi:TonB family protein